MASALRPRPPIQRGPTFWTRTRAATRQFGQEGRLTATLTLLDDTVLYPATLLPACEPGQQVEVVFGVMACYRQSLRSPCYKVSQQPCVGGEKCDLAAR
jgi:hypothetical protein